MKITLYYFAGLRECAGRQEEIVETSAPTALALYTELQARYHFPLKAKDVKIAINDQFEKPDTLLKDGDAVAFIPPVAGG